MGKRGRTVVAWLELAICGVLVEVAWDRPTQSIAELNKQTSIRQRSSTSRPSCESSLTTVLSRAGKDEALEAVRLWVETVWLVEIVCMVV